MNRNVARDRTDARRYAGGARNQFVKTVCRLAADVRQGRSPSECWREVDRAMELMKSRMPGRQN